MSCTCQRCDNQYKVDIIVNAALWKKIRLNDIKGQKEGGLLCCSCITTRRESKEKLRKINNGKQ